MINIRNRIQLVGPVSGIQTYETENGTLYSRFNISTTESFASIEGEKKSVVVKHACIVFNKQARFVRDFLSNGNEVAIEGRIIHLPTTTTINSTNEVVVEVTEVLKLH
jgi:single-strand DNA-binding protein